MLRTLLESQPVSTRRSGGTMVSVGLHTAMIGLAIIATAHATATKATVEFTRPIFIRPPVVTVTKHVRTSTAHDGDVFTPVIVGRLVPPVSISDHLPPIDFSHAVPDRSEFGLASVELGLPASTRPGGGLASPTDGIYAASSVERAAMPRDGNPAPVYPPALRAASLEGSVVARFVVDTTGRAEPQSIVLLDATHPLFAEAVRHALLRSRYVPAMLGDRPVRQLVEQRFAFSMSR
jgi:protein TonB